MSQTKAQLLGPVLGTVEYAGDVNFDSGTLFVDSANNRVGVGTDNPLNTFHVKGPAGGTSARFTDATNATVFISHPSAGKSKIADSGGNYGFEFDTASVNILSGGTERLRIDTNGNVGIGTTNTFNQSTPISTYSPILSVQGSIIIGNLSSTDTDRYELQFYRRGGGTPATPISTHDMGRIAWYGSSNDGDNANLAWSIGVNPDGGGWTSGANRAGYMTFNNHNGEQIRITSSGNVGIGTDDPWDKLVVYGGGIHLGAFSSNSGRFTYDPTAGNLDISAHSTGGSTYTRFLTSLSGVVEERVRITSSGDVGIGTDNPSDKLHVIGTTLIEAQGLSNKGSLTIKSVDPFIRLEDSDGISDNAKWDIRNVGSSGFNILEFRTINDANTVFDTKVVFKTNGNVGIGTTNPDAKLHVYGASHNLRIERTGAGAGYFDLGLSHTAANNYATVYFTANSSGGTSDFIFRHGISNSYEEKFRIRSNGNVGVGETNPQQKLHVSTLGADNMIQMYCQTGYVNRIQSVGANTFAINTGYFERLRIDTDGNVGIGTTNPTSLLHLNQTVGSGTTYILFSHNGNSTGQIYQDGSGTGYSTTSDYRLKENILPLGDGLTRIKQLKPCKFNWKNSDNLVEGFIAHEVQSVVPSAVIGEKDQLNTDGTINPQQLDNSKLIPLLVKCIQELTDKIELLESKLLGD